MATSTWELHLGHPPDAEVRFLEDYFDVIRRSYPDQLDYTTDDDGLHVMVASLKILTMVFGGLDHRTTPKSLTVEVNDDLQNCMMTNMDPPRPLPLTMKAELKWEEDDEEHASIELVTR